MHTIKIDHDEFNQISAEVLSKGGSFRCKASGQSMWPFIKNGAILTVESIQTVPPEVGEVVLYRSEIHAAVHRIVGIHSEYPELIFMVQGDACPDVRELVPLSDLLGKVTRVEYGGRVCNFSIGWLRVFTYYLHSLSSCVGQKSLKRLLSLVPNIGRRLARSLSSRRTCGLRQR
jgi:signal peptidase I